MNRYVKTVGAEAFGQWDDGTRRKADVVNGLARIAIKMTMLLHIGAKSGRPSFQGDLARQTTFDQRVKAIVNRSHRNVGHLALSPDKDFLGSWVVPFLQQQTINMLPLRGKTKTARRQTLIETLGASRMSSRVNHRLTIPFRRGVSIFGIILKTLGAASLTRAVAWRVRRVGHRATQGAHHPSSAQG